MSERRLRVLTVEDIVRHRPADAAWRASDTPAGRLSVFKRAWSSLSARDRLTDGRPHAREANQARGGCLGTLSRSLDPPSQAVKPLRWLMESAGCWIGALAPLGSPALVPGPISSGFEPVSDPTISPQPRAADARFGQHAQAVGRSSCSDLPLPGLAVSSRFWLVGLQARSAPGLAAETGSSRPVLPAKTGEGHSMSKWNPLGPEPDEVVARVLQRLRDDGLLPHDAPRNHLNRPGLSVVRGSAPSAIATSGCSRGHERANPCARDSIRPGWARCPSAAGAAHRPVAMAVRGI